jgi:23S rRNA pseudouridine2605 synthase
MSARGLVLQRHGCSRECIRQFSSRSKKNNGKPQRIERIISNRGVGSRKEVAALFKAGRVMVDDIVVRSGATKYPVDTKITIVGVGETVGVPLLAAFYKPVGMVSTMKDNWGRSSLAELELQFPFMKSMHPVGRLDADTSGLLLFSSEGTLTQKLLHPSSGIVREYQALVVGDVDRENLTSVLKAGVKTTDGVFPADLLDAAASDELVPQDEREREKDIKERKTWARGGSSEDTAQAEPGESRLSRTSTVTVTVTEGKYRMVRRVLHNAGHSVVKLHRARYGQVHLGDLGEGEVRVVGGEAGIWARGLLTGVGAAGKPATSGRNSAASPQDERRPDQGKAAAGAEKHPRCTE